MAGRVHRSVRLTALTLLLVVAVAAPARADGGCFYDPVTGELVCDDGGGGGGGGGSGGYWTSWTILGPCGGGAAVGGGLVDLGIGLIAAARYRIVNGEVVETQNICIDLGEGAETAWQAVVAAAQALPDPAWEADPDPAVSTGLTGLETWLWSSHETRVGPIAATWAEPVTGLVFGVEGRGWTETLTWNTGEAAYQAFAPTWDTAATVGGSIELPAATHIYNTTSLQAGHPGGYPVALRLLWVGEYRVAVPIAGGVWTTWARFASTLTETVTDTYEVVEVRSKLTG